MFAGSQEDSINDFFFGEGPIRDALLRIGGWAND
jgi:hypothetical protein